MIKKIAHLADYHVHNTKWHERYLKGNEFIYKKLKESNVDRIVLVGDLFENFVQITNEAKLIASDFLNKLSEIAPVIIVDGNHDIMKKNLGRLSSIKTLTEIMNNPNITYYDKSGFFEDDNVIFVNHSHLEKNINPWRDIEHTKSDQKIYIDFWHDPINGCLTDIGKLTSASYRNINEFKGDFGFFGDIHKFQYLTDNNLYAYSSSVYQQNSGESIDKHGFILWDIINKESEFIEVEDDYKMFTFKTHANFDYDDITFNNDLITDKSSVRIQWIDYPPNINTENEIKLLDYVKSNLNVLSTNIEYHPIDVAINSITSETDIIDIEKTMRDYLEANKWSDEIIDSVINLDGIINDIIQYKTSEGVNWQIDKVWFDNFKSYGDDNIIDWSTIKGVIEIAGLNQAGKTTILDAISYCLYGKTLATTTKEKWGDVRFINNKNDSKSCLAGVQMSINNQKFALIRQTTKSFNKKNELNGVTSVLNYYNVIGSEIDFNSVLTEEQVKDTQKLVSNVLGDFNDFIRLVLTTADNLNSLLSVNRSEFIDSILRDAGYDIFELKLEAYKNWKKNFNLNNPLVKPTFDEKDIEKIENDIEVSNTQIKSKNDEYANIKINIDNLRENKESISKTLHQIDNELMKINESDIEANISLIDNSLLKLKEKEKSLNDSLLDLPNSFDSLVLDSIDYTIKKANDDITIKNNDINKLNNDIIKIDNDIINLINSRKNELNIEINKHNHDINEEQQVIIDFKNSLIEKINNFLYECTNEYNLIESKIISEGINIKSNIIRVDNLRNSKTCITCKQELKKEQLDIIEDNIKEIELANVKLNEDLVELNASFELIKDKSQKLKGKRDLLNSKTWLDSFRDNITIAASITKINDIKLIIDSIRKSIDNIENETEVVKKTNILKDEIVVINESINVNKGVITNLENKLELLNNERVKLKENEKKYQEYLNIKTSIDNIPLEQDNLELKKKLDISKLEQIKTNLNLIEYNKIKNIEIDSINIQIDTIVNECTELETHIKKIELERELLIKDLINKKDIIKKYKERNELETIHNLYKDSISRDGIPMFLLKRNIELINHEIANIMFNLDFVVFFNNDLDLMMSMKSRRDIQQNVIESSGKERTFAAIALKMALIQLNKKSRPNFILMDEVMGKLSENSIGEFIEMLNMIKNKINKIIIVEHNHQIDYDAKIVVSKNDKMISSLHLEV